MHTEPLSSLKSILMHLKGVFTGSLLFLFSFCLYGQDVGLLVSPGKLSKVHAELSGIDNCTKCHTAGKKTESRKCLDCHKDLAARIKAGTGYHRDKPGGCVKCHPEHYGLDFKLIHWKVEEFNHDETGYKITGLHRKVPECSKCHTPTNSPERKISPTYLVKDPGCTGCHKDTHNGSLGTSCAKCHNVETPFKQASLKFDHAETAFPLKGAHGRVACDKCHKQGKWKGIPFARCSDCHKDRHKPSFNKRCNSCHNVNSWKLDAFNHNLTRYPLKGKHRALSCKKCHPPSKKIRKMPFANCTDCHRKDPHMGQFKSDCKKCHVVRGFKRITFNHDTCRYPLTGKHRDVSCNKCHYARPPGKTVVYKPLGMSCKDCHSDIHLGQFEKSCESCHQVTGFKQEFLDFDHQIDSDYKLVGKHAEVTCGKCHLKQIRNFPAGAGEAVLFKPMFRPGQRVANSCNTCHQDYHLGQLGNRCGQCHTEDSFKDVRSFDHQKSRFSLNGFHEKVECGKCHPRIGVSSKGKVVETIKFKPVDTTCKSCHSNYDHSKTAFPLTGKHQRVTCNHCHNAKTPNTSKTRQSRSGNFRCRDCHANPHPGGQSGCTDCHSTDSWLVDSWR
ncbi:MAG: hypothetical protein GY940_19485 [bacterium]|nr:hypothetical protein [bacterium]